MRLPLEGLGHQSSHTTSDPQFVPPIRCTGLKIEQNLKEGLTNDWPILRWSPVLTLLMIFYSTCRQESSVSVIREASDGQRCRYPQTNLNRNLGNPVEDGEEGLEPERSKTSQVDLQNQLPWAHRGS